MAVEIIAEAGVNHNGEESLAMQLVEKAVDANVDIVKFQIFDAKKLASPVADVAGYQERSLTSKTTQLEMLAKLELPLDAHRRIARYCDENKCEYMATAFDSDSLNFLVDDIGVRKLKIGSGDLSNAPHLLEHARTGRDIILSTGMGNLGDIEKALGVLAFGYLGVSAHPTNDALLEAYASSEGQSLLASRVTLLHCTTEYPAPYPEINLRSMSTMHSSFGLPVGYSDHSECEVASLGAVALGACCLEKHYTLDKSMVGPDHMASLDPHELGAYVSKVRLLEMSLGTSTKAATFSEVRNSDVARRSLVAISEIEEGDRFTEKNIGVMRPGGGLSPFEYWNIIQCRSNRRYDAGDLIDPRYSPEK